MAQFERFIVAHSYLDSYAYNSGTGSHASWVAVVFYDHIDPNDNARDITSVVDITGDGIAPDTSTQGIGFATGAYRLDYNVSQYNSIKNSGERIYEVTINGVVTEITVWVPGDENFKHNGAYTNYPTSKTGFFIDAGNSMNPIGAYTGAPWEGRELPGLSMHNRQWSGTINSNSQTYSVNQWIASDPEDRWDGSLDYTDTIGSNDEIPESIDYGNGDMNWELIQMNQNPGWNQINSQGYWKNFFPRSAFNNGKTEFRLIIHDFNNSANYTTYASMLNQLYSNYNKPFIPVAGLAYAMIDYEIGANPCDSLAFETIFSQQDPTYVGADDGTIQLIGVQEITNIALFSSYTTDFHFYILGPNGYSNSSTSFSQFTGLEPGTYTLVTTIMANPNVPALFGCDTTQTITISSSTVDPCQLVNWSMASANSTNESFNGADDGKIILNGNGITANFGGNNLLIHYTLWDSNTVTQVGPPISGGGAYTWTGLPPGSYYVKAIVGDSSSPAYGCEKRYYFLINSSVLDCNFAPTLTETFACDSTLLQASVNITANTPTHLSYTWHDPNGAIISACNDQLSCTVLDPGTYSFSVFASGTPCAGQQTTITTTTSPFTSVVSTTDEVLAGGSDGTATVVASGGTAPYWYLWSHVNVASLTDVSYSNLAAGSYTVVVTDANGCVSTNNFVIASGDPYPTPDPLDVCLNLDTGNFEFTDNNDYPTGTLYTLPYRMAIVIRHSNGVKFKGSNFNNPDIISNTLDADSRTYDSSLNLGENFSIPIPTYGNGEFVPDIYKIIIHWNFQGTNTAQYSKTVRLDASDLKIFNDFKLETELTYNCRDAEIISKDITNYDIPGVTYKFNRTHELFAPIASALPSPIVSSYLEKINHGLYEGEWNNIISVNMKWRLKAINATTHTYISACVKKTLVGSNYVRVLCNVNACYINKLIKKLKSRYDQATCDRDIIKANKFKAKYQRATELFDMYIVGSTASCADDYSELFDILDITNLDEITSIDCKDIENTTIPQLIPDCPCNDALVWSDATQGLGNYNIGDIVNRTLYNVDGLPIEQCFILYNEPVGGFTSGSSVLLENPGTDMGLYWTVVTQCMEEVVYGCTDEIAINYNPLATINAGCFYTGCTDASADNYMPGAVADDGSCFTMGCTDSLASNYDAAADTDDGSCTYSCTVLPDVTLVDLNLEAWFESETSYGNGTVGDYKITACANNLHQIIAVPNQSFGIQNLSGLSSLPNITDLMLADDTSGLTVWTSSDMPNLENLLIYNVEHLTSLDFSNNPSLELAVLGSVLPFNDSTITSLDFSNNPSLNTLIIEDNFPALTSIDLTQNTLLSGLLLYKTALTSLDLSNNVNLLNVVEIINNSQLTSIDLGSSLDLTNINLVATGNHASLVIHVGTTARVAIANAQSSWSIGTATIAI